MQKTDNIHKTIEAKESVLDRYIDVNKRAFDISVLNKMSSDENLSEHDAVIKDLLEKKINLWNNFHDAYEEGLVSPAREHNLMHILFSYEELQDKIVNGEEMYLHEDISDIKKREDEVLNMIKMEKSIGPEWDSDMYEHSIGSIVIAYKREWGYNGSTEGLESIPPVVIYAGGLEGAQAEIYKQIKDQYAQPGFNPNIPILDEFYMEAWHGNMKLCEHNVDVQAVATSIAAEMGIKSDFEKAVTNTYDTLIKGHELLQKEIDEFTNAVTDTAEQYAKFASLPAIKESISHQIEEILKNHDEKINDPIDNQDFMMRTNTVVEIMRYAQDIVDEENLIQIDDELGER